MNITNENINSILERYITFTNELSNKYNYPSNIKHLLYLIIPAFIIRYGANHEKNILSCFEQTRITLSHTEDKHYVAYFARVLRERTLDGKQEYYTDKKVILNEYKTASFTGLIDNIVHEFNHAVNSINNEIKYDDNTVSIRTGLSYLNYNKSNLIPHAKKDPEITLEEIINTKQSADIINIINSFNSYNIENEEFKNTLYSVKHEISGDTYESKAYYLQSYITKDLMNNKTFIPTIENLRFKGFVDDIPSWFDNIIGRDGTYKKLVILLDDILELEKKYSKAIFFKNYKLNVIRNKISEVVEIVKDFDNKSIFK